MENRLPQLAKDYGRIEQAIHFIDENFTRQPDLAEIAKTTGLSDFHFQRIFQRWAGISPKRFLQFLTKEYAKELLRHSSLLDVSYESGLSGPGRLHDLFVTFEGMTPGEYKEKGKGLMILYGFHPTPFGECLIAQTDRGICNLFFIDEDSRKRTLKELAAEWPQAQLKTDQKKTAISIERIFNHHNPKNSNDPLRVFCRGTNFQIKIWEALLKIPSGTVVTYQTLARRIGYSSASRAVGNAVGRNPVAYLIPCHRVIRSVGGLGGYRWGIARKRAILAKEAVLTVQ